MKNKVDEGQFGDPKQQQEVFDENIRRPPALAHQQYNTDQIVTGGLGQNKPKKKKKKKSKKNVVNQTAMVGEDGAGLEDSNHFADPNGHYQQGKYLYIRGSISDTVV